MPRFTDDEPFAAVNPRDPDQVIAIWQTRSGAGSVIQSVRSVDGGRTWTAPRAVPINACAGGPIAAARLSSDPWVTFGADGRAYLSAIAWTPNPDDGPDDVSVLVVVGSPDGGKTLEAPVAAAVAPSPAIAHDNLAITADPTRPLTVYAATTRVETPGRGTYYGRLGFTRSVDGGRTWTPIRAITPAVNGERIGAPQIVVDARSGRLYAVYHRSRQGRGVIGVMISDDRGESWGSEIVAAAHERPAPVRNASTGDRFVLAADIIQAVVSPATGQLVIAYADARADSALRASVSVVWSADGSRWSQPLDISDARPHTAWLPAIAAGADGDIAVSYFVADFASSQPRRRLRVMLRRLDRRAAGFAPLGAVVLDEAPLDWPGDYQSLVRVRDAFLATYGRTTDIVATRSEDARREP